MRIEVKRTGGFAGITRAKRIEVERGAPPPPGLEGILGAALPDVENFAAKPESERPRSMPDSFLWIIIIDQREVELPEQNLPDSLRALTSYVFEHGQAV